MRVFHNLDDSDMVQTIQIKREKTEEEFNEQANEVIK